MSVTRADLLTRLRNPATTTAYTQKTILLTGAACADMREAADEIESLRLYAQRLNDEIDMYWNGCRTDAQVKRINEAQRALHQILHD